MTYNTFQFNTNTFNSLAISGDPVVETDPKFGDFVFGGAEVIANGLDTDNAPSRELNTSPIPRRHGEVILSDFWRKKSFLIRGVLDVETKEELEAKLDEMKLALSEQDGWFEWTNQGQRLKAKANWSNPTTSFDRTDHYKLTFCEYQIVLEAYDPPFSQEENYSSVSFFDKTSLEFSEQTEAKGNAPMSPIAILVFSAADAITNIKFENDTTGESIDTDLSISPGDILKFDSENRKVLLNGVEQDYNGFFPELKNGVNAFTITLTGTSATYSLTVKHKNFYL